MVKIKWRVNDLPILIDEDNNIWRDKFISNKRFYNYKKLNFHVHQGGEYITINRKRYSKSYIKLNLYKVNEIISIVSNNQILPF